MSEQRVALVVAIDQYEHPGLRQLVAPVADAEALAGVLGDRERGGFDVEILHNAPASTICERLEDVLTERQPSDLVLLHFSCHGLKDDAGELYLAATNTVPNRLASTAVDSVLVNRLMRRSRARRVVLLLDCCYGGAFERGVIARAGGDVDIGNQFATGQLGGGRGRAIITASSAMEYAFEGTRLAEDSTARPSIFTAALVEGLTTGDADRDNDGQVALGELYDYVFDRVRERSPQQTPSKWEFGVEGELYLARNPHRRIVPGRLPPDLAELAEHPHAEVRITAVQLLERAACESDLPRAAAARRALTDLADDDSRRVSAAASTALQLTGLRLSVPSLDLGQVMVGGTSPLSAVELEGPPLALELPSLRVAGPLNARLERAKLSVTWTPTESGNLDAAVTVSGLAGEVRLAVTGQAVVPAAPSMPPEEQVEPRKPTVESPNPPTRSTFDTIDTTPNRFEAQDDWDAARISASRRATTRPSPGNAPPATDEPALAAERTPDRTQHWQSRFTVRYFAGLLAVALLVVIIAILDSTGRPTNNSPTTLNPGAESSGVTQSVATTFTVAENVQLPDSPTFQRMQQRGRVLMGVKYDQPGLGQFDPTTNTYSGFDVEIGRLVAAKLGFDPTSEIDYVVVQSAAREDAISRGDVDYYVGTYTINDNRKQRVGFAGPYFVAGQDLLVRADDTSITGPQTLQGKKVCSATGSTPIQRVRDQGLTQPENIVEFQTYTECVDQLLQGQVDAVTTDDAILKGYASQRPDELKVVGQTFSTEPYGIGVPRDDTALRNKVNDILEEAYADGTWQQIYDATLGLSGSPASAPQVERY